MEKIVEIGNELLQDVKSYLNITWTDNATDKKISGMILRGINALNGLTGSELDFDYEGRPRELLFIRVMYERSAALDDFKKNYQTNLNELVIEERRKRYVEE